MKKIRLGHIGTAHDHSGAKMMCARKFPELFEIVGIVEPDEKRRAAAMKNHAYDGLKWMTEDELFDAGVDAVLVEGFEYDLARTAQRCIDHGVHVHVDKPAGDNVEDLEKLLRSAKAKNLTVQVAYMYRYNPAVLDLRQKIKDGVLGEIYEVDATMNTRHPDSKRGWLSCFEAGIMYFLGCHMVDFVYSIMGVPDNIIPFRRSTGFNNVYSVDHGFAVMEYKKGISTVRATATEVNGYGRRQLVVCGTLGTYVICPLEGNIRATICEYSYSKTYADAAREIPIISPTGDERYDEMLIDFAKMVRGEKENPFSFDYEIELQKLVLACCGQDINYKEITKI